MPTEQDIVAGGKVITLTLDGSSWKTFDDTIRQAIIDGLDSDGSETLGWDAVVKAGLSPSDVVRTSNSVCTITLPAFPTYDITANETVTATVPTTALNSGIGPVATPTFTITFVPKGGGHVSKRGRKRYIVEVDGQDLVADSISEVQSILAAARETAVEAAERDVTTEVTPKPPKVKVLLRTGKKTTSKVIQREVSATQKAINRAYVKQAKLIRVQRERDEEISRIMLKKIKEDDEDTIKLLLM